MGARAQEMKSLIYWDQGKIYEGADGFFELVQLLEAPWNWMRMFSAAPKVMREWGYDQIAKHRYQWFGKYEQCRVPNAEERKFFLE